MNHHEEEGIVDGIRTEEGEGDGKRKLDDDVEGEMRKRKAWKFLISSWVVIDMGRPYPPPMKIASNLNFRRHLALPTFDQDYPIKESRHFLPLPFLSLYIFIRVALRREIIRVRCQFLFRIGRELDHTGSLVCGIICWKIDKK